MIGQSALGGESHGSRSDRWFPRRLLGVGAGDLCFINSIICSWASFRACVCALLMRSGRWRVVANKIWERRAKWARKKKVSLVSSLMQTPSSLSVPYSLLPNWRRGLQAEQADRALISNMMDTEPSLPLCIRLPRSLPLQPRHVLGRYEPNHSLAKAATHPAPSSPLPSLLHPSVSLVTVYAHPAPSPRVTLPPTLFMQRLWVE